MTGSHVNSTRMEQKKLKNRLATARKGHRLLKDKRDEMIREFMETVKTAATLRAEIESGIERVNAFFSFASAVISPEALAEALLIPARRCHLFITHRSVMSVPIPVYSYETENVSARSLSYGFAFTSGALDSAVLELEGLLPKMLILAEKEKAVQLLANEIEKTRRRVNALEYVMIPQYESGIKRITMKLEENERGNTTRLMKVKDMMIRERFNRQIANKSELSN